MIKLLQILTLLFAVRLFSPAACDQTLRSIFVVHRHGDRAPMITYPNDPYKDGHRFPQGLGRLTTAGKQRMYDVGRYLRRRYGHFLGDDVHEVYARSTSRERCLESVELLVNGAYKPPSDSVWAWNRSELWIPVPVHTVHASYDLMLNLNAICAAKQAEMRVVYSSDVIRRANERWADLYRNLSVWTGQESFGFKDGDFLFDALFEEKALIGDFQRPSWLTDEIMEELKRMRKTSYSVYGVTPRMQQLTMGCFLNELKEKISQAIVPSSPGPHYEDSDDSGQVKRLNVYSTHDIFLYNLLADLGMPTDEMPPYGAAVIFELFVDRLARSNFGQSSSVQIWYLNETLADDYLNFKANPLRLPGYDRANYTVDEFLASFAHLLMSETEVDSGCKFDAPAAYSSSAYIIVIIIESIVILLFVGQFVKQCACK